MNYEFISEIPESREAAEQRPLIRNLERGVILEQRELGQEGIESAEAAECIGTPEKDMENWHRQTEQKSCVINCQELVAEQILHRDLPENELIRLAKERGWYCPESGTPESHMGSLLEEVGIEVDSGRGQTLSDLAEGLRQERKIICSVNSMILDNPEYAEIPGRQADHAVEVIGIDLTRPNDIQVILNDTGVDYGRGRRVSADTFMKAWNTSRNFAVTAWKED